MFITVAGMGIVLSMGAFALDTASWYRKHHQAQIAADAAALAAANCLDSENPSATTTTICTSTTDTTRASSAATTAVANNGVSLSNISYGTSTSGTITTVTVTTAMDAPSLFAGIAGINSTHITARAVANITWQFSDCTNAGNRCLMFYAASSTCGANNSNDSIQMQIGNSDNLRGGVFSNGDINDNKGNGGNYWGPITYGASSSCQSNTGFKNATLYGGSPVQQTLDRGTTTSPNWLIDYSKLFPACSEENCTGPSGTPAYCTYAQPSFGYSDWKGNGVYCAYGTGNVQDPSTWTGAITFQGQGQSGAPPQVTLIGGTVSLGNNSAYSSYANNLLAYATGSGSATSSNPAFTATGGNLVLAGDVFAPNGGAAYNNGNVTYTGFTQALTIYDKGGDQTGAGPSWSGGPTINPGTDTLGQ